MRETSKKLLGIMCVSAVSAAAGAVSALFVQKITRKEKYDTIKEKREKIYRRAVTQESQETIPASNVAQIVEEINNASEENVLNVPANDNEIEGQKYNDGLNGKIGAEKEPTAINLDESEKKRKSAAILFSSKFVSDVYAFIKKETQFDFKTFQFGEIYDVAKQVAPDRYKKGNESKEIARAIVEDFAKAALEISELNEENIVISVRWQDCVLVTISKRPEGFDPETSYLSASEISRFLSCSPTHVTIVVNWAKINYKRLDKPINGVINFYPYKEVKEAEFKRENLRKLGAVIGNYLTEEHEKLLNGEVLTEESKDDAISEFASEEEASVIRTDDNGVPLDWSIQEIKDCIAAMGGYALSTDHLNAIFEDQNIKPSAVDQNNNSLWNREQVFTAYLKYYGKNEFASEQQLFKKEIAQRLRDKKGKELSSHAVDKTIKRYGIRSNGYKLNKQGYNIETYPFETVKRCYEIEHGISEE